MPVARARCALAWFHVWHAALQEVCKDKLKKRASDPVLRFWRAFGVCMEGAPPQ